MKLIHCKKIAFDLVSFVPLFFAFSAYSNGCTPKKTLDSAQKDEGLLFMPEGESLGSHLEKFKAMFPKVTASEIQILQNNLPKWLAATARVDCKLGNSIAEGTVFFTNAKADYASAAHVFEDVSDCKLDVLRIFRNDKIAKNSELNKIKDSDLDLFSFKTARAWGRDADYARVKFLPDLNLFGKMSNEGYLSGWDVSLGKVERNAPTSWIDSFASYFSETAPAFLKIENQTTAKVGDGVVLICRSGNNGGIGPQPNETGLENEDPLPTQFDFPISIQSRVKFASICQHRLKGATQALDLDYANCLASEASGASGLLRSKYFLMGPDLGFNLGFGHINRIGKVHAYFDVDSFSGCSGGPVLSLRTGDLVGLLQSRVSRVKTTEGEVYSNKDYYFGEALATIVSEEALSIYRQVKLSE